VVSRLAVHAQQQARRSALLAEEHAALRRVATLVARGAPAEELFAAVVEEAARVLPVDIVALARYESDAMLVVVATSSAVGDQFPVGSRWPLGGENVTTLVARTGAPARIDSFDKAPGPLSAAIRERGLRSSFGTPVLVEGRLWGVLTASTTADEPLPSDAEPRLASFTELVATAISNTEARAQLAASRARLVAATDDERRRVVRDLHDGGQQRLVYTVLTLRLAQEALRKNADDLPVLLTEALANAEQATAELRELAHGILPAVLTRGGLRAGVDTLTARASVPVDVDVTVDRLPEEVEATAYYVIAEALTNIAKHACAEHAEISAQVEDGALAVKVCDDGIGGARRDGTGLIGLADRVAALDGELAIDDGADGGTVVAATIPLPVRAL
jgi:signal transduction histidine kinase